MADRPAARRRGAARNQRRGTLIDSLPRTPVPPRAPASGGRSGSYPAAPSARDANAYTPGYSEEFETPGRLTLPSMPRVPAARRQRDAWDSWDDASTAAGATVDDNGANYANADYAADYASHYASGYASEYAEEYGAHAGGYVERADDVDGDGWGYRTRTREHSLARPLIPALPQFNDPVDVAPQRYPPLSQESAPDLAAYRPVRAPRRVRLDTQALARTARNPWTITRLALALIMMTLALVHAPGRAGEQTQPLMTVHAQGGLAPGGAITSLIQPETQLLRPDLYDSFAQFQEWGGAACSAAAISEVLTAYGVPHATIGHEIDEFGSYISPNGGLLNRHGFVVVAAKHNLRADESMSLSYNQLIYLTEQLGMPVIVNVRMSYGYYHFFSGGHFLTVVGGDAQGLKIVDSSEYYIHYLPRDVFYQMFTGYTAAIVPGDYHYTLPNN